MSIIMHNYGDVVENAQRAHSPQLAAGSLNFQMLFMEFRAKTAAVVCTIVLTRALAYHETW